MSSTIDSIAFAFMGLFCLYVVAIVIGAIGRILMSVFVFIAEWFTRTFGR